MVCECCVVHLPLVGLFLVLTDSAFFCSVVKTYFVFLFSAAIVLCGLYTYTWDSQFAFVEKHEIFRHSHFVQSCTVLLLILIEVVAFCALAAGTVFQFTIQGMMNKVFIDDGYEERLGKDASEDLQGKFIHSCSKAFVRIALMLALSPLNVIPVSVPSPTCLSMGGSTRGSY